MSKTTQPRKMFKFDVSKMVYKDNLTNGNQLDSKKVFQLLVSIFGEDFFKGLNRNVNTVDEKLYKEKEGLNKNHD